MAKKLTKRQIARRTPYVAMADRPLPIVEHDLINIARRTGRPITVTRQPSALFEVSTGCIEITPNTTTITSCYDIPQALLDARDFEAIMALIDDPEDSLPSGEGVLRIAFGTYRVMGEHLRVLGYTDPRAQAA